MVELPIHRRQRTAQLFERRPRMQKQIEAQAQRCKWIAKLVRQGRQKFVLLTRCYAQRRLRFFELGRSLVHPRLECLVQLGERARLAEQIGKHGNLVPQDLGIDRFCQVVDRARSVTRNNVLVFHHVRSKKDDRDLAKLLGPLDDLRELETRNPGHSYVEDDGSDVVIEKQVERLVSAAGANESIGRVEKDRLERVEIPRLVIDEQDVDSWIHHRYSHTRSSESS